MTTKHKGRPPLTEGQRRVFTGFALPPKIIAAIKKNSGPFGSQANLVVEAVTKLLGEKTVNEGEPSQAKPDTPEPLDKLAGIAPEILATLPEHMRPKSMKPALPGKPAIPFWAKVTPSTLPHKARTLEQRNDE